MSESLLQVVQIPMEVANKYLYMCAHVQIENEHDGVPINGFVYEMHCSMFFSLVDGFIEIAVMGCAFVS